MNNDEITALNDHMIHALGRINHLEVQVSSLARELAKLQAQVAKAQAPGKTGGDEENDKYWAKK